MIRLSGKDKILEIIVFLFLVAVLLVVMYPLYFVLIASISDPGRVAQGDVWVFPRQINFNGYKEILTDNRILTGYRNTFLYTLVGTIINLALTVSSAYALSRKDLVGRGFFMGFLLFTMFFSGGLIPLFLLVRNLGLYDSFFVMVLVMPNAVSIFNLIIARTFFVHNIPDELLDAAMIDGCSDSRFLLSIVIPISGAIIAVLTVFYAVNHWNAFFGGIVFLKSESRFPLQLVLRNILLSNQMADDMWVTDGNALKNQMLAESIKYGVIVVASIPVLVMYPFVQKYYVRGVMVGSVKG